MIPTGVAKAVLRIASEREISATADEAKRLGVSRKHVVQAIRWLYNKSRLLFVSTPAEHLPDGSISPASYRRLKTPRPKRAILHWSFRSLSERRRGADPLHL
jgi:hypothetical protein